MTVDALQVGEKALEKLVLGVLQPHLAVVNDGIESVEQVVADARLQRLERTISLLAGEGVSREELGDHFAQLAARSVNLAQVSNEGILSQVGCLGEQDLTDLDNGVDGIEDLVADTDEECT